MFGVLPEYGTRSIVEIPHFILHYFGIDYHPLYSQFLKGNALKSLKLPQKHHLLLFIIDGLGYGLFKNIAKESPLLSPAWDYTYLTSVFPSTTASALMSFATGLTPAEHGYVGYRFFLKEPFMTFNSIFFKKEGTLRCEIPVEEFLKRFSPPLRIYELFARAGIKSHVFIYRPYENTPFANLLYGDIPLISHEHEIDLLLQIRKKLETTERRSFVMGYIAIVDSLSHKYGPEHYIVKFYIKQLFRLINELFSDIGNTLILITADHGQVFTPPERAIFLSPEIEDCIIDLPAGEPRAMFVRVKDQRKFIRKIEKIEKVKVYEAEELVRKGLFGENFKRDYFTRIGDFILLPEDNYFIVHSQWKEGALKMMGKHGGLLPEEMLVPLIYK